MANPPTDDGYIDIDDLLETEELKAKEKIAQQKAGASSSSYGGPDHHMGGTTPDSKFKRDSRSASYDPLRLDRPSDSGRFRPNNDDRSRHGRYFGDRHYANDRHAPGYIRQDHIKRELTDEETDSKHSANGSVHSRQRGGYRSRDHDGGSSYRGGAAHDDFYHYRPAAGEHRRGGRSRSPDRRGRRDDRDRRRDRDGPYDRRPHYGGNKRKTPEPTDDERDRRTVFVQQLAARLRSRELKQFFEQAGEVVDAQIVKDRVSGRSKGVGYVEFKDEASVQAAIELTGHKLLNIPIIAQLTEAEKNRQVRTTEGNATQTNGIPFHRLYVGNIHFSLAESDLRHVFEPFGELEFIQLQKEEGGRSRGYGFVQYLDPAAAKRALEHLNGFELINRPIRVGLGNDKFTTESTQSLLQRFGSHVQAAQHQGSQFSGMGGRGAHAGGTGNFDRSAAAREVDKTGGASALDDTDVGGVNFSNYSRDLLMRKLARTDEPEQKIAPKTQAKKPIVEQPTASRCILIKNLYNQNEETEPGWQKELKEDVKTECEEKYGKVVHIDLALDNNDGEVYVKFDRLQGGENAYKGLNGRWFGYRMLTAQYVVEAVYNMNFPKAA